MQVMREPVPQRVAARRAPLLLDVPEQLEQQGAVLPEQPEQAASFAAVPPELLARTGWRA